MLLPTDFDVFMHVLTLGVEMVGNIIIAGGCLRGLALLMHRFWVADTARRAQVAVSDAILAGLSFKVAASLLKTTQLQTWTQIGVFAAVLTMRSFLKLIVERERRDSGS